MQINWRIINKPGLNKTLLGLALTAATLHGCGGNNNREDSAIESATTSGVENSSERSSDPNERSNSSDAEGAPTRGMGPDTSETDARDRIDTTEMDNASGRGQTGTTNGD